MGRSTRRDAQEYMPKGFRVGPFVVLVIVSSAVAGVLVAGVPDVSGSSESAEIRVDATGSAAAGVDGRPLSDETASPGSTVGDVAAGDTSTGTTELAVPTTEAATTSSTSTTTSSTSTTTSSTTTSSTTTTTSTTTTVPAATIDLRVVIANGTDEAGLATRVSDKLSSRGYTDTHATDTASPAEATVIYYAPGLKDDAAAIAGVLELWAALEPMPAADPTADGSGVNADLLIVFG